MTEVPHLLQYFIENCGEIFDGIAPTDDDWPAKVDTNLQDRENLEGIDDDFSYCYFFRWFIFIVLYS